MMNGSRFLRPVAVVAIAGGFLAMATLPASAATPDTIKGPQNLTVSCNATIPKKGVTVVQDHTGDFKVEQHSTSPSSKSVVWAVSGTGHSLPTKVVSNGHSVLWTDVLPGSYTIHVHRDGSKNCNGIGFGDGNYNWNYSVVYDG